FEVGEPANLKELERRATENQESHTFLGDGLDLVPGSTSRPRVGGGSATLTSQTVSVGYWHNWWEDFLGISVHGVKKWIAWSWDGSCVLAASHWTDFHWLASSGWTRTAFNHWIDPAGCAQRSSWADATYRNGTFCWPGVVWSYYDDVKVTGKSNG